ncbi:hypothetical protein O181_076191 [Austropuccinia psidii MF-1]|uniref:Uncharacterized protein n=1 Tax=Austropuccinia psidii MF-1 TaxID=1389203 RepID=A0A9Q3F9X2_9BASI|nr:hypothetical protein [Austropuccinia psidii MF-1]
MSMRQRRSCPGFSHPFVAALRKVMGSSMRGYSKFCLKNSPFPLFPARKDTYQTCIESSQRIFLRDLDPAITAQALYARNSFGSPDARARLNPDYSANFLSVASVRSLAQSKSKWGTHYTDNSYIIQIAFRALTKELNDRFTLFWEREDSLLSYAGIKQELVTGSSALPPQLCFTGL